MVRSEENRRVAMLNETNLESSAMVSNKGVGARFRARKEVQSRTSNREGVWCTFCKKPRHTQETFFKLHGKEIVLSRMGSFKNLAAKNQAYLCSKGQEEEAPNDKTEPLSGSDLT